MWHGPTLLRPGRRSCSLLGPIMGAQSIVERAVTNLSGPSAIALDAAAAMLGSGDTSNPSAAETCKSSTCIPNRECPLSRYCACLPAAQGITGPRCANTRCGPRFGSSARPRQPGGHSLPGCRRRRPPQIPPGPGTARPRIGTKTRAPVWPVRRTCRALYRSAGSALACRLRSGGRTRVSRQCPRPRLLCITIRFCLQSGNTGWTASGIRIPAP
jgi:hypothetical protein